MMDDAPTVSLQVELSGIRILADRSVKVSFTTLQEVDDPDLLYLIRRQTSSGWLVYSERSLDEQDIPDAEMSVDKAKSPSARLRAVLYVAWTKKYPDHASRTLNTFEAFYRATIESYIEKVKARIDELEMSSSAGAG